MPATLRASTQPNSAALRTVEEIEFLVAHLAFGDTASPAPAASTPRSAAIVVAAGKGAVRVIVPDYAKSAATLIALGADQIVMSDTSELGPIDPQVTLPDTNGGSSIHSARSYIDAFDQHADKLRADPDDTVARLMLDKLDPAVLEKLKRATKRSTVVASELLQTTMIKDKEAADDVAARLSDTAQWHSHGQMIDYEQCRGVGLTVVYLDPSLGLSRR